MAVGRKTGGRDFVKGKPGGPGRPRMLPELKDHPNLKESHIKACIAKFSTWSTKQIIAYLETDEPTVLEAMVGRIIVKALKEGDTTAANFIFDRSVGKVKERIEQETVVNFRQSLPEIKEAKKIYDTDIANENPVLPAVDEL